MSESFMNWTSRVAIDGRVVNWRRQGQGWNEYTLPGDYHMPFGRDGARAEAAKWIWQL